MLYNALDGRRVKEPHSHVAWVHSALKQTNFELRQVFFGEHLLKLNPKDKVAIVESEKTAIIASAYLPQFTWLATGGLQNLNVEKCRVLTGRTVLLFPDLGAMDKWSKKLSEITKLIPDVKFKLSSCLESVATEEEKNYGLDLADYLIRFDLQVFRKSEKEDFNTVKEEVSEDFSEVNTRAQEVEYKPIETANYFSKPEAPKPDTWDIASLEMFFNSTLFSDRPIVLRGSEAIPDVRKTVASHLEIVKAQNGNRYARPYYDNLIEIIEIKELCQVRA